MRSPGIRLHKLALFGWAVLITAVLLLLSLPVLAGKSQIVPALNLAIWRELWNFDFTQSVRNLLSLNFLGLFRDYTPEFICCIVLFIHCFPINSIKQDLKLFIRTESCRNYATSNNGSNTLLSSYHWGRMNHKSNHCEVKLIKSQMNDNRTVFVWDHLQNFYNLNK